MITLERIKNINSNEYLFTEMLLTQSFPIDEYRNFDEQRQNVSALDIFHLYVVKDEETPIGFISIWKFNDFSYVEHFAIEPTMRKKGYGSMVLDKVKEQEPRIVLEVEIADNDVSQRRIDFYTRNGFVLCKKQYIQPAYRPEGNELLMHIMYYGNVDIEKEFNKIKNQLYRHVYGKNLE